MTTELWLVRHGTTDWNLQKRYQGHTDIPLNTGGLEQARELAEGLAGTAFDAVFTSDLTRARQTAGILASRLNAPVFADARLREARFGDWEGENYLDMREKYPEFWKDHLENPNALVSPGGESLAAVADRMRNAAQEMASRFPAGRLLIVAHGLSLAVLVCLWQGKPLNESYSIILNNAHPQIIQWPVPAAGAKG